MSTVIAFIGIIYKRKVSMNWRGDGKITDKERELILIPLLNTLTMFAAVLIIIGDITLRIADRYES
jgi:hypothetical protein